jgi:anti-anti-sigma factor
VRRSAPPVVVDLGGLAFIDSAGLAVLVNAARRLDRAGRPFSVTAPAGPPRRAIELARLSGVLRLSGGRPAPAAAVAG